MMRPVPPNSILEDDLLLDRLGARMAGSPARGDDPVVGLLAAYAAAVDVPITRRRRWRSHRALGALGALAIAGSGAGLAAAVAPPPSAPPAAVSRHVADRSGTHRDGVLTLGSAIGELAQGSVASRWIDGGGRTILAPGAVLGSTDPAAPPVLPSLAGPPAGQGSLVGPMNDAFGGALSPDLSVSPGTPSDHPGSGSAAGGSQETVTAPGANGGTGQTDSGTGSTGGSGTESGAEPEDKPTQPGTGGTGGSGNSGNSGNPGNPGSTEGSPSGSGGKGPATGKGQNNGHGKGGQNGSQSGSGNNSAKPGTAGGKDKSNAKTDGSDASTGSGSDTSKPQSQTQNQTQKQTSGQSKAANPNSTAPQAARSSDGGEGATGTSSPATPAAGATSGQ